MNIAKIVLLLMVGSFAIAGCDNDAGPAERAGERLDDAGEELREAGREAGDAIEDACEEVREGAGAEDTDC